MRGGEIDAMQWKYYDVDAGVYRDRMAVAPQAEHADAACKHGI
jgi:hypothetical protein